jgi:hypothetical protein
MVEVRLKPDRVGGRLRAAGGPRFLLRDEEIAVVIASEREVGALADPAFDPFDDPVFAAGGGRETGELEKPALMLGAFSGAGGEPC